MWGRWCTNPGWTSSLESPQKVAPRPDSESKGCNSVGKSQARIADTEPLDTVPVASWDMVRGLMGAAYNPC